MATGDTAPPPLTIQPPPIEPLSDDDNSSPLSDVEDKDADPDDLHDLHHLHGLHHSLTHGRDHDVSSAGDLSDANDTEAETERLYDTPQKPPRQKDVVLGQSAEGQVYERTPSKLRQHQTTVEDDDDDDDEPLSDEDVSMSSSPPAQETKPPEKLQSPTLDILAEAANQEAENRKRKRSMPTEPEQQEPLRKRNGSVPAQGRQQPDGDTAIVDYDGPSSNTQSGEHSADEAPTKATGAVKQSEPVEEAPSDHEAPPPKLTRSGSKKKKGSEDTGEAKKHSSEARDRVDAEEEHVHTGEDETIVDEVDEEAEAAHKNEEERMADHLKSPKRTSADDIITVERKRAAYEQLTGIEKRFATFRDRYISPLPQNNWPHDN